MKRTVPLVSNGKTIATATRSFVTILNHGKVIVYAGKTQKFSLNTDFCDGPLFIYPFADEQRYLCDYDDDTAMLVFVVDCRSSHSAPQTQWPTNDYVRGVLANRMTNAVMNTTGAVRLPEYSELQEVSAYLENLSSQSFERQSFPTTDLGFYRIYVGKEFLLGNISTNRQSVW